MEYNQKLMLSSAEAFKKAAERCQKHITKEDGGVESLLLPSLTNYAFSAEVYMKLLIVKSNGNAHGHKLDELCKNLPDETKESLRLLMGESEREFEDLLKSISNYFVESRYFYESSYSSESKNIDLNFLSRLVNALSKLAVE